MTRQDSRDRYPFHAIKRESPTPEAQRAAIAAFWTRRKKQKRKQFIAMVIGSLTVMISFIVTIYALFHV